MLKWVKRNRYYIAVFGAGVAVCIAGFAAAGEILHRVSTNEFCGTTCHEMDGVYKGWKNSGHYVNTSGTVTNCVDCHLPARRYYFKRAAVEAKNGIKNILAHRRGGYDPNEGRKRVLATMPDEKCTSCHANLMAKPKSIGSRIAHQAWAEKSDPNAARCVDCHDMIHERR